MHELRILLEFTLRVLERIFHDLVLVLQGRHIFQLRLLERKDHILVLTYVLLEEVNFSLELLDHALLPGHDLLMCPTHGAELHALQVDHLRFLIFKSFNLSKNIFDLDLPLGLQLNKRVLLGLQVTDPLGGGSEQPLQAGGLHLRVTHQEFEFVLPLLIGLI